jgi:hypothetical protein
LPQQLGRLHKVNLLTIAGEMVESMAIVWAVLAAIPVVAILMSVVIGLILIPNLKVILLPEVIHDYLT